MRTKKKQLKSSFKPLSISHWIFDWESRPSVLHHHIKLSKYTYINQSQRFVDFMRKKIIQIVWTTHSSNKAQSTDIPAYIHSTHHIYTNTHTHNKKHTHHRQGLAHVYSTLYMVGPSYILDCNQFVGGVTWNNALETRHMK